MRIRLRVPKDGEVKSDGFRGWLQRFRDSFNGFSFPPGTCNIKHACQLDKRWSARGDARYFFEGRHCRKIDGAWQSEFVFSVLAAGEIRQIRVVLPEEPVAAWEQQHDQRMSEDHRLRLALETVESLVDRRRFPDAITVSAETIAGASKV